jgi:hypothetical protein
VSRLLRECYHGVKRRSNVGRSIPGERSKEKGRGQSCAKVSVSLHSNGMTGVSQQKTNEGGGFFLSFRFKPSAT